MIDSPSRTLAVILHADVVGSTTLVRDNESLAHTRIQEAFRRFSSRIEEYAGVTRELRGDALVAEFARVSDVVLAQRIEQLAQPGGVCIHGAAYETLPRRLPFDYSNLGERQLKGFEEAVRVYAVTLRCGAPFPEAEPVAIGTSRGNKARQSWLQTLGALVPVVIASVFATWVFWKNGDDSITGPSALLSRPSIAVLPFHNLSANPEQEYFSDGITDDIINDLSKFSNLTVIARNSAFAYKGKPTSAQAVGEELGVEYLLEGSVQRADARVRINTQLVDTKSQRQIWAMRYDEPTGDLFDVQDRIARNIVQALSVKVSDVEKRSVFAQIRARFPVYDLDLRAQALLNTLSRADNFKARELFRRSIALDSNHAPAYAGLGTTRTATPNSA